MNKPLFCSSCLAWQRDYNIILKENTELRYQNKILKAALEAKKKKTKVRKKKASSEN